MHGKMVIYHAQFTVSKIQWLWSFRVRTPSWVGYGQEYGLAPVVNGNSYSWFIALTHIGNIE